MMSSVHNTPSLRSSILGIAGLLAILQIVFPPKLWNGGFVVQPIGHSLIFTDPMAGFNRFMGGASSVSIDWVRLLVQLVVTGALTLGVLKFAERAS